MIDKSFVSVIIPTFNRAQFLSRAIESLQDQVYSNVEVIVVDDGSTDETPEIITGYGSKIIYIQTEHAGTAHARNVGMKAARGEYIAFLDSDDSYLPNKLALQVDFIKQYPEVGMVYTEFSGGFDDGSVEEYHMRTYHQIYRTKELKYENIFDKKGSYFCESVKQEVPYYVGNVFKYMLMAPFVPTNTVLFPKHILDTVGFQNEQYRFGQEYEFVTRICKYFDVAFLNTPTYIIYHHKNQATHFCKNYKSLEKKDISLRIQQYHTLLNTIIDWGYNDEEYYSRNRKMIDQLLAEWHRKIGIQWLDYGDRKKAHECFKKSILFNKSVMRYLKLQLILIMPGILRPFVFTLKTRIVIWALNFKNIIRSLA